MSIWVSQDRIPGSEIGEADLESLAEAKAGIPFVGIGELGAILCDTSLCRSGRGCVRSWHNAGGPLAPADLAGGVGISAIDRRQEGVGASWRTKEELLAPA